MSRSWPWTVGLAALALALTAWTWNKEAAAGVLILDHQQWLGRSTSQAEDEPLSPDVTPLANPRNTQNSTIRLARASTLVFTFLGFEAGYDNAFYLDPEGDGTFELIFSNRQGGAVGANGKTSSAVGEQFVVDLDPSRFVGGAVPFMIKAGSNGSVGSIANGSETGDGAVNYDVRTIGGDTPIADGARASSLIVYFDDGGAGPDVDYNDLVVSITAISAPNATSILGFGLAALGITGHRRRRPTC